MARQSKSVQEQVQKNYPEFTATVDGLSVQDLEGKLSTYAKEADKVDEAKKADEELTRTKALVAELSGPYSDTKKAIGLKMKYIISLIKEKGGDA